MADIMTKARTALILDNPFFGSLALRLTMQIDHACDTAWTDGETIGYNPDFIDKLSFDQARGLLAHEIMHVVCNHHTRRGNRNPGKWNIAADYAINLILVDSGFVLPDGGSIDIKYRDKSADEIYSLLPESTGKENDPGKCGEIRDCKGKNGKPATAQEKAAAELNTKTATIQAANIANAAGKLPGNIKRLVSELVAPAVNWQAVLARFVQSSAKNDYTWTRPNTRYMASGLYMPSLQSEEMGQIVLAIDTSGSISQKDLNQFAAELQAIVDTCKPEKLTVIYCDTQINGTDEFFPNDLIKLEIKGGGGTSFTPVFKHVQKTGEMPACLIYLTDGYCTDYPKESPGYPVIWAINGKQNFKQPFGETVNMK